MILFDIVIVLVTFGIYFSFGWLFFSIRLFKDYEIQGKIPVTLFSITFSLSCLMFQLVIFEILHILHETYACLVIISAFIHFQDTVLDVEYCALSYAASPNNCFSVRPELFVFAQLESTLCLDESHSPAIGVHSLFSRVYICLIESWRPFSHPQAVYFLD
jgi:hypothetical protein